MGAAIYKLYNEKNIEIQKSIELQAQINSLNKTVGSLEENFNNISDTDNNKNTKNFNDIILDGQYSYYKDASDLIWSFSKDGKAAMGSNMYVYQGTYKTIKENYIEIHYTTKKEWDDELNYMTTSTIDEYEYISIEDNNKIYLTSSNGNKQQIERIR